MIRKIRYRARTIDTNKLVYGAFIYCTIQYGLIVNIEDQESGSLSSIPVNNDTLEEWIRVDDLGRDVFKLVW